MSYNIGINFFVLAILIFLTFNKEKFESDKNYKMLYIKFWLITFLIMLFINIFSKNEHKLIVTAISFVIIRYYCILKKTKLYEERKFKFFIDYGWMCIYILYYFLIKLINFFS